MLACGPPVSGKEQAKQITNAPNHAKPPNHSFPPPRSGFVQQIAGDEPPLSVSVLTLLEL